MRLFLRNLFPLILVLIAQLVVCMWGSLLQIMILRLLQKHGHRPIVLLGGGTTLIGDPSGKDSTRKILNQKNIKKNILGIKKLFESLLDFKSKKTKPVFVDNYSWLGKLNYIDFLRTIGSQFTLNKMLTYDSVKLRLERAVFKLYGI